jgi:hypothetical protein
MRPLLLLLVFALSAGPLLSADGTLIDPSDAPKHIGQSVTVSGLDFSFQRFCPCSLV